MTKDITGRDSASQRPATGPAGQDSVATERTLGQPPAGGASCCGPRALWGWSPPALPAESHLAGLVDRWLPRTGLACLLFVAAVAGLLALAPHLSVRAGLADDGIAFLSAGSWCALNFWRCRHAHCLVSGAGWLGLGVLALAETGIGHSVIGGDEQLVFLGVLVGAVLFEGAWYFRRGTNSVTPGTLPTYVD